MEGISFEKSIEPSGLLKAGAFFFDASV